MRAKGGSEFKKVAGGGSLRKRRAESDGLVLLAEYNILDMISTHFLCVEIMARVSKSEIVRRPESTARHTYLGYVSHYRILII